MQKRTKIVCTIGPACETQEILEEMIEAGMNVARLNFSHGSYEHHTMLIKNIRNASEKLGIPVAILQDLQGPKIRVGIMPEEGIELKNDSSISFDTSKKEYKEGGPIPVDWEKLHEFMKPGERILLNDGKMEASVESVEGHVINARVRVGGKLTSHKGMNVPDTKMSVRAMTDKDKEDAKFGVANHVDFIALSFVMSPDDVVELQDLIDEEEKKLKSHPTPKIQIITKIERPEAVNRLEEILDVADGIMVARGDLGVELPAQRVPVLQKQLIEKAVSMAKPVIVATQMLDSMQLNPRPTRAEVSDVANAVIDHTDAVMLSNESAVGSYPVETVQMMSDIITETENSEFDDMPIRELDENEKHPVDEVLSSLSRVLAEESDAKAIVAASIGGQTAKLISRYRPEMPIIIATPEARVLRQLCLVRAVSPFLVTELSSEEDFVAKSLDFLKKQGIAKGGDSVVILTGEPLGEAHSVSGMKLAKVN